MIDRRSFLHVGASAALGTCFPALARRRHHVVVIGAGIGGLAAAWWLEQAGAEVTVIELAGRIGGRNFTLRDGDLFIDLAGPPQSVILPPGSAFDAGPWRILPAHQRVRALAATLGLGLKPVSFVGHADSHRITGGMDGLPRALASRLRTPIVLNSALVSARPAGRGLRLWLNGPAGGREVLADALVFAALPGRLLGIDHGLPGIQRWLPAIAQRDALKVALTATAAPAPGSVTGIQALVPTGFPGLGVVYGNAHALDSALRGEREIQIGAAQSLWGTPTAHPIAVRFAAVPGIGAAAEALPGALARQLAAGMPPWFFCSDALSPHNGWQEGALHSAEQVAGQVMRYLG